MENVSEELDLLKQIAQGIASVIGDCCEVVIHDHALKDKSYDHSIVYIVNGNVTNRHIGDCGTNLGLEILRGKTSQGDKYNYFTQTHDGKILRSSSIYIRNSSNAIIGSICINIDISNFIVAEKTIQSITGNYSCSAQNGDEEIFSQNIMDLLDSLMNKSVTIVGKPVSMMNKNDKLKGIKFLDDKGAFLIMKSGERVSSFYGISKFTLYSYLEEIRATNNN